MQNAELLKFGMRSASCSTIALLRFDIVVALLLESVPATGQRVVRCHFHGGIRAMSRDILQAPLKPFGHGNEVVTVSLAALTVIAIQAA